MSKEKMLKAYIMTEKEWSNYGLKEKSKKIKDLLESLEANTPEEQASIDNQMLMIEELDPKELSVLLDSIHSAIMENCMKIIEKTKG